MAEGLFQQDTVIVMGLLVSVLLSGGFHLDGLADTADAISVKPSGDTQKDRERRLQVAKDSSTGAIGAVAVVFDILIKYVLIKNICNLIPSLYYLGFLLMPVVSNWAMTVAIFHGRPAKDQGLGYLFIKNFTAKDYIISGALLFIVYGMVYGLFNNYLPANFITFYIIATVFIYLFIIFWLSFCNKRFGGQTGDTLGALSEISELSFLVLIIIWWRFSIVC